VVEGRWPVDLLRAAVAIFGETDVFEEVGEGAAADWRGRVVR